MIKNKIFKQIGNIYPNNIKSNLIINFKIINNFNYAFKGYDLYKTIQISLIKSLSMKNLTYTNIDKEENIITL